MDERQRSRYKRKREKEERERRARDERRRQEREERERRLRKKQLSDTRERERALREERERQARERELARKKQEMERLRMEQERKEWELKVKEMERQRQEEERRRKQEEERRRRQREKRQQELKAREEEMKRRRQELERRRRERERRRNGRQHLSWRENERRRMEARMRLERERRRYLRDQQLTGRNGTRKQGRHSDGVNRQIFMPGDRESMERGGHHRSRTTTEPPPIPLIPPPNYTSGPALHLVALNRPVSGRMRGIRGADYECHRQARSAGMMGTYRAFLSTTTQNLDSIIYYSRDRQIPIINKEGQMLFNSWEDLVNGAGGSFNDNTPLYSFDGKDVMNNSMWPQKIVWHGSSKKGWKKDGMLCNEWHTKNSNVMGLGSSLNKHMLLDQDEYSCNNAFVVLCIQNTARPNLHK